MSFIDSDLIYPTAIAVCALSVPKPDDRTKLWETIRLSNVTEAELNERIEQTTHLALIPLHPWNITKRLLRRLDQLLELSWSELQEQMIELGYTNLHVGCLMNVLTLLANVQYTPSTCRFLHTPKIYET